MTAPTFSSLGPDHVSAHRSPTHCSAPASPGQHSAPNPCSSRTLPGSPSCIENLRHSSIITIDNIEADDSKSITTVQDKLKETIATSKKLNYENLVALLESHPWKEETQEPFENDDEYSEHDNDYDDMDYDSLHEVIEEPVNCEA